MKIDKDIKPAMSWAFLDDLEVGDSVLDEHGTTACTKGSKLYGAMQARCLKRGWSMRGRKVEGGVRVWRVS